MTPRTTDTRRITIPEEALTDLASAMVLLRGLGGGDQTIIDIAVDAMLAILNLADIEPEGAVA